MIFLSIDIYAQSRSAPKTREVLYLSTHLKKKWEKMVEYPLNFLFFFKLNIFLLKDAFNY